ncbi:MAG: cysteine desulfurase, partial [Cyclobacteriaceae bacterium]
EKYNSNIHRGIHTLAEKATAAFEETRKRVAEFINASEVAEVIFTKGATEGINLVASTHGRKIIRTGDEILISHMEHHSNIVPWQMLCEDTGATLKIIPVNDQGEIIFDEYLKLLNEKTKFVSVVYVSNTLGTINPVEKMISAAHQYGAKVLLDCAQAASHMTLDVQKLDCDFLVMSAHKAYGPTGVGVLYGKRELLEAMPPYQGGGEMIKDVSFDGTTYNDIPYKFEAGTPNIGDVVAFRAALDFIDQIGKEVISNHEDHLLAYATEKLNRLNGFSPVGTATNKISVISFNIDGIHSFDLGMMLDAKGIAVRTGHHCTQPLMDRYAIEGTARASFAVYNTTEEIDFFVEALENIIKIFRK